jgi:hypothetical protein
MHASIFGEAQVLNMETCLQEPGKGETLCEILFLTSNQQKQRGVEMPKLRNEN